MPDRSELRRLWDQIHQTEPAPELPEEDLVAFIEHVSAGVSPGAPLLDLGCGRGRHTLYLSRLGFDVFACDLSLAALETARGRSRQAGVSASFQAADLEHLPYAGDRFAAAVCVHVLPYHFKAQIREAVLEMGRVLQSKGRLYFDLLDCSDAEYGCGQRIEEHTFLQPDGLPVHFSSPQEISELSTGLELERVKRIEFKPSSGRKRVKWIIWAAKQAMQ